MAKTESNRDDGRSFVNSLDRGLRVISAFGVGSPLLSVTEAANRAGISRAAARRFLLTLEQLGYVGSDEHQRYFLKSKALSLGYAYLSSLRLDEIAFPALRAVAERADASTSMAVLSGSDVVYIVRAERPRPLQPSIRVGERLPAFSTALGRVLLSGLPEQVVKSLLATSKRQKFTEDTVIHVPKLLEIVALAHRQGWCAVTNQQLQGWTSVAVPIRNAKNEIVAAINASAHHIRQPEVFVEHVLPLLRQAGSEIEWAIKSTTTPLAYR